MEKLQERTKHVLNVSIDGSSPTWLDFKKSVKEWEEVELECDDNDEHDHN